MTKEQIIKKFKKDRSIKDSYKLTDDEMYFIKKIFELQKKIENLEHYLNQAPTAEKNNY